MAVACTCAIALATPAASAQKKKTLWEKLKSGHDLIESVPTAALFDGIWTLNTHYATELTNRTWDAPYPWGTIGQYSTRLLYGTTWTFMVAGESLAVISAMGGTVEWIAEASYRVDWMVAIDAPACPRPGAFGGCGMGVGDFAFIQVRPRGWKWWLEVGGGWFQQRIKNDQYGTVAESAWAMTPVSATYELRTDPDKPVALRAFAGPGIYFGMHNGHFHQTLRGEREKGLNPPWHEMYPLDAGIGPGGRLELRAIFFRHVALEGELVMAPFVFGGPTGSRPSTDIAPLDFEREGTSVWRKLTAGISYDDPKNLSFKPVLGFWAAELSERPITKAGYRGVMLRFDVPLRLRGVLD